MSGRITQRQQWVEGSQPFFRLLSLYALRLVDDQNGIRLGDDVNRTAGAKLIEFHINAPRVFAAGIEGLRIDNHDVDRAVRSKAVDLRKLGRIVDKETDLLPVLRGEMVLRHLKRFVYAFADGDARHYDDKLTPTIVLVQLVHGLDIRIGLAYACFHLNGQIELAGLRRFNFFRRFNLIRPLDLSQTFQNHRVGKLRHDGLVAPAHKLILVQKGRLIVGAPVHHVRRREIGLSSKNVYDGFRRICLKFLMFKLQPHSSSPLLSSVICS